MYGYIIIRLRDGSAQIRTNAYDCIYDYLTEKGFPHDIAEDIASWAENAPYGAEYELDEYLGTEIFIVDAE